MLLVDKYRNKIAVIISINIIYNDTGVTGEYYNFYNNCYPCNYLTEVTIKSTYDLFTTG